MNNKGQSELWLLPIIAVVIIIVVLGLTGIAVVPAGHVGVADTFGSVSSDEWQPGFYFKVPWTRVVTMSTQTQPYTMSVVADEGNVKGRSDVISALTKEGLSVDLDLTVLYKLTPDKASDVYQTVGAEYEDTIVRPQIRAGIREVVANYEAKNIYSSDRAQVALEIQAFLVHKVAERGIVIEDVLLRHVQLPAQLEGAIQAKLTSEQEAEQMVFVLQKEELEADRKVVEAQGIKDSQAIIDKTLTTQYLQYLWIQTLNDNPNVMYVATESGLPLFKEVGG